jgi:ketosteroid isomerase-like protein
MTMEPMVGLVRRWAVDWLAGRHPEACPEILAPGYNLLIGGFLLDGRDTYIAGTLEQLDRFPGLGVTVHELITSGDEVALRFTEHGADSRRDGGTAGWGGVALFRWDGSRLSQGFAEEDYLSRRRQLATGECDPIEAPAAAPWNTVAEPADPAAEDVVRRWLDGGDLSAVDADDSWLGHDAELRLDDVSTELDMCFSASDRVGFHGLQRGRYAGGLPGVEATGAPATLHLGGLVTVRDGKVAGGRVIRDRLGLSRALAAAVAP